VADSQLETPVLLMVYNRPALTRQVLAAIAAARPRRLLIVADGPASRADEERCAHVRALLEDIPWPCDVARNYSAVNLGVRIRPPTGIDWAFSLVDEAIILEDDCLPHPTFFSFCSDLLAHYRNDERIMQVAGSNFQRGARPSRDGYYFSVFYHLWGWATWKRAWQHYDVDVRNWPELKRQRLLDSVPISASARRYWNRIFDRSFRRELNTWDFQWQLAMWSQYGLAAVPDVNLISNIGFGDDATHTTVPTWHSGMAVDAARVLRHPNVIAPDRAADDFEFHARHRHQTPLAKRLASRLRRALTS
jgi:hypothetical protein